MISYLTPIYLDFHTVLDVTWNSELNSLKSCFSFGYFILATEMKLGHLLAGTFNEYKIIPGEEKLHI